MFSFEHVRFEAFGYALPEKIVTSAQLEDQLAPVYDRFGLHQGRLEMMTGVRERRFWDEDTVPSDASTRAGQKALENADVAAKGNGGLSVIANSSETLLTIAVGGGGASSAAEAPSPRPCMP